MRPTCCILIYTPAINNIQFGAVSNGRWDTKTEKQRKDAGQSLQQWADYNRQSAYAYCHVTLVMIDAVLPKGKWHSLQRGPRSILACPARDMNILWERTARGYGRLPGPSSGQRQNTSWGVIFSKHRFILLLYTAGNEFIIHLGPKQGYCYSRDSSAFALTSTSAVGIFYWRLWNFGKGTFWESQYGMLCENSYIALGISAFE